MSNNPETKNGWLRFLLELYEAAREDPELAWRWESYSVDTTEDILVFEVTLFWVSELRSDRIFSKEKCGWRKRRQAGVVCWVNWFI